jgi:hypothetical protein
MDAESCAVDCVFSLQEVWALVAAFNGLVGAWRLLGVCRAARAGAKEFLGSLPRLVVCGGYSASSGRAVSEVWGLDLATMRWEAMPALLCARRSHACCAVRGALIVIGGVVQRVGMFQGHDVPTSRVEMLSKGARAFVELPPLSCGAIYGVAAIAVDESRSAAGQVLLLGGIIQDGTATASVRLVDLATGVSTVQADLLHARSYFAAARLPHGYNLCGRHRRNDDRDVGAAGTGCAGGGMDGEGAARNECWARWLQRMHANRRPLRRPRGLQHWRVYVLV